MKFKELMLCRVDWDLEDQRKKLKELQEKTEELVEDIEGGDGDEGDGRETSLLEMALNAEDQHNHARTYMSVARHLPGGLQQLMLKSVPYVGAVYQGLLSVKHARIARQKYQARKLISRLHLSDDLCERADLCVDPVCQMLGETAIWNAMLSAQNAAAFGVRFAPTTSWVGTATGVAEVLVSVARLARSMRQVKSANNVLRWLRALDPHDTSDANVEEGQRLLMENPILACYIVAYNADPARDFSGDRYDEEGELTRTWGEFFRRKPKHRPLREDYLGYETLVREAHAFVEESPLKLSTPPGVEIYHTVDVLDGSRRG